MAKKKNFDVGDQPRAPIIPIIPISHADCADALRITLLLPHGRTLQCDYAEYLGLGFDELIYAIAGALNAMIAAGALRPFTMESIISSGLPNWWMFCTAFVQQGNALNLSSINRSTIEAFENWLSMRTLPSGEVWSENTMRTVYAKVKTALNALVQRKLLDGAGLFLRNPFPGSSSIRNRRNYIRPLSDTERERMLRPLSVEVRQVYEGTHPGSLQTRIGLCAFAIFLKTGVNCESLLDLPRDLTLCFLDHPRINRKILMPFKARAEAFGMTPILSSDPIVVSLDVYKLCQKAAELTEAEATLAIGTPLEGLLWLYRKRGKILRRLSSQTLSAVANAFTERHGLKRDDGTRLKMSSQLFRNTKTNRVWRASKGDILATARSVSNTPESAEKYLTVTPDMLEEHRLAGEVLVDMLSSGVKRDATPHSGCKDSLNGELAPKNGDPCVDFLSCFRCKSQVIVGEDLYKLFSFYWAVLAQRSLLGPKIWNKLFGWIVRVIDRDIAPRFSSALVAQEKNRARSDPHPMWRSDAVQAALRSIS